MKALYKEKYVFYCHSIVMTGDSFKHQGLGGSESALTYMAQEISRCGKEVIVFCKTDAPGLYNGVYYERIERFAAFIQRTIIDIFISVRSPDIFAAPIKARLKALWLHDAADQPHLLSLHDESIRSQIDCYITLSQWQTQGLVEKFDLPKDKIFVSRNGVKRQYFKTYRNRRKQRLVYTSTPFRGLEVLLRIFPEIRKQVHDAELFVYSSMSVYGFSAQEDQERFGHIYKSCQQPGVTLVGSIPQKELARELSHAKVFVYPNIFNETSCIAALEGQAAGLPVVASERGALPETVRDGRTGILVPHEIGSPAFCEGFVRSAVELLTDPEKWQSMSSAAHERVMQHFCWDTIAAEWVDLFDQTIPRLSLCMIVRDESQSIEKCLKSVEPIVDQIVVVDTGSTDNTKAIAASCGAEVFDFEWNNDFSAARNFSLEKARGDWILVLDADELISKKDLQKMRQLLNVSDAYRFFQRSYLNDSTVVGWKANTSDDKEAAGYSGYFDSPLTRLFRNGLGFRFEGAVHELIEPSIAQKKSEIVNTTIPIHHYGKVVAKEYLQQKGQLYLKIGQAKTLEYPDDPRAHYDLGAQYFEMNRLAEAKAEFEKALSCDPQYYRALCDLGLIYAKDEKYAQARELLDKTIVIKPEYISAHVNLGIVYEGLGDLQKAKESFESALRLDPANSEALKNCGLIRFYQQEFEEAYRYFARLKQKNSVEAVFAEYAHTCYELGKACVAEKDFTRAKKYFLEALEHNQSHLKTWNDLGVLYANHGATAEAEQCFLKVISEAHMHDETAEDCSKAYVNLGFVYNNKGEFKRAIDVLERAVELQPTDSEIYNHIGIAKCGIGQLAEGVKFFEMTLKLNPHHGAAKINLTRVNETLIQELNYQAAQSQEFNRE
jgi:Tfp pilus assembly protein PilF/glycosyltransferase involved in cell wall biosynthesis